ncbi:HypC/HybG/HupF family hydrogenase formation chaperone [Candidatus Woesearchaeota archaeon]|nr:HypC/HybG/HupF family hydrogenase formation chaperone [Candidatus Woesearchaeota archaeon]
MCYAIPAKITRIEGDIAIVDYGGVIKKVNHTLVDEAKIGDFILIHAGFAIEKVDKKSAEESLEIIKRDLGQFKPEDFDLPGKEALEKMKGEDVGVRKGD